jgi:hypothetical protein
MSPAENDFIQVRIGDLETSSGRFAEEFSGLAPDAMDIKPDKDRWSINECLDHLIQSNARYHSIFDALIAKRAPGNFWYHVPFAPALWGKMILGAVSPQAGRKSKTFTVFLPSKSHYGKNLVPDLAAANRILAGYLPKLQGFDLDKTLVTSPVGKFVVYDLRHLLLILTEHEKRHFNQAMKVKKEITGGKV